jgi:hypothetical protein
MMTTPTWAFSLQDAATFGMYDALRAMMVVGVDGRIYVLSRAPGADPIFARRLVQAWRHQAFILLRKYRPLVESGRMTSPQAESALRDELWRTIAPVFGLRYDQLTLEQGAPDGATA